MARSLLLLAALAVPAAAAPDPADRSPAVLDDLLARYDRMPAGPERDALATTIDVVAGQRYATVSRLYWYTDLPRAEAAAKQLGRPILALRMLGDLREDLSWAHTRLFRATLYANHEVSQFLRSHFVLYWSSERPVPKVTIDMGDGRKIERTTTGNSIHYVLDADGHVLDALPGLYAPTVFQHELAASLALAAKVRGKSDTDRTRIVADYHRKAADLAAKQWTEFQTSQYIPSARKLLRAGELDAQLVKAQLATMSKMVIEVPDLASIGAIQPSELSADDVAAWAMLGQRLYFGYTSKPAPSRADVANETAPQRTDLPPPPAILDAPSRALVTRLWGEGDPERRAQVIARLEQHMVADTAQNELALRAQIHRHMTATDGMDLTSLNAWVYDVVFHTPKSDPWLGLNARTDFTGLPDDGVVMP